MRTWEYIEPGPNNEIVKHRLTDHDIIEKYYETWLRILARAKGASSLEHVDAETCILDFAAVHWASVVEGEKDGEG